MVKAQNLTFTYRKSKQPVLQDFSLTLEAGKIYGLLGKNGVGKSTLLYLISGLLTPKKGNVLFHDIDVRRRLPITLQDMFIVPEEFQLEAIPLKRYIDINAPFYPRFNYEAMTDYLRCFELDMELHLGRLSMGQAKKVYMSFALATNTSLLLMDEPTNGLDIPGKSQFRQFLALGMNPQKSILISTHQVLDLEKTLDHVIIMDQRNVLLNASVASLRSELLFTTGTDAPPALPTLYSMPYNQGTQLLLKNDGAHSSDLNLELLFNAMHAVPEAIQPLFHSR